MAIILNYPFNKGIVNAHIDKKISAYYNYILRTNLYPEVS